MNSSPMTVEEALEAFNENIDDCPACLCILASKDARRQEAGVLIRKLIHEKANLKEEFFAKSPFSPIASLAFWNSYESLTMRYDREEEKNHEKKISTKIFASVPVIFSAHL